MTSIIEPSSASIAELLDSEVPRWRGAEPTDLGEWLAACKLNNFKRVELWNEVSQEYNIVEI
jgi:hypothetical protein